MFNFLQSLLPYFISHLFAELVHRMPIYRVTHMISINLICLSIVQCVSAGVWRQETNQNVQQWQAGGEGVCAGARARGAGGVRRQCSGGACRCVWCRCAVSHCLLLFRSCLILPRFKELPPPGLFRPLFTGSEMPPAHRVCRSTPTFHCHTVCLVQFDILLSPPEVCLGLGLLIGAQGG